jgi:hypothetical protein
MGEGSLAQNYRTLLTPTRYLASAFVDARAVNATSRAIAGMLTALRDDRFLPTTVQEVGPGGLATRMAFETENDHTILLLQGARFDFIRQYPPDSLPDNTDFEAFCAEAQAKLQVAVSQFQLRPHRLTTVREMTFTDSDQVLRERVRQRLMIFPPPYEAAEVNEWDWRANSTIKRRIGTRAEETNNLTSVRYGPIRHIRIGLGSIEQEDLRELQVTFDINTSQANVRPRFTQPQLRTFFGEAPGWHEEIEAGVLAFVFEEGTP